MEDLWAPWRMPYLKGTINEPEGCIFCSKARSEADRENYVVLRGKSNFALLNLYPYANGHFMVAPYAHTGNLVELDSATVGEMMEIVQKLISVLRQTMNPAGFNLGMNIGRAAGAGIVDHVHMHLVPRWNGDTNFMTVTGHVRVIPEMLDKTYGTVMVALREQNEF
ncbi:MAG: HIT domain-containing protein [Chloroflexi bacterium]|nr:HIT domain-containing protein [Chloroflexota bacterium]